MVTACNILNRMFKLGRAKSFVMKQSMSQAGAQIRAAFGFMHKRPTTPLFTERDTLFPESIGPNGFDHRAQAAGRNHGVIGLIEEKSGRDLVKELTSTGRVQVDGISRSLRAHKDRVGRLPSLSDPVWPRVVGVDNEDAVRFGGKGQLSKGDDLVALVGQE